MFKKLDFILQKYDELSVTVSDPAVIADQARWQKHIKEMSEMEPIVLKYREYRKAQEDKDSALELLNDSSIDDEMREMAKEELAELNEKLTSCEQELKILLLPKDPNDEKNVYLELRAGMEARKPLCSPAIFCACTCAIPSAAVGKWSLRISTTPVSAELRKASSGS